jgi:HAD superfamily phosphoserine phosphatase-like hydrolase
MKLAIYDFDGTYVDVQTVPFLFKLWKEQGKDEKIFKALYKKLKTWYILHKLKIGWNHETFRKNAMALTIDLLHSLDEEDRDKFLNDLYLKMQAHINQDLKEQLKKDKEEGYHTILLSGSFDIMLTPFLNEGFDDVIGTVSRKNGELLSYETVEIIIRDKKVEAIKNKYPKADLSESKAYADSYYDLPLLLKVKDGIAYHPDKKLLKYAQIHDLKIYK